MDRASTTSVRISTVLRDYCGGARELSVPGTTVLAALREIERLHPSLYVSVCDETGKVRRHVNLFVNSTNVRDLQGLDTELAPGDVVTIMPSVSGG